jgi:hypothetical protein
MNKTAIIIGGVALVGVVAYFYFKPKLSASTGAGETGAGETGTGAMDAGMTGTGTGTGTTGGTMPPAGTVLTTPEQVEAITIKVSTARDLTKTICDLKKQYKITEDQMNDFMNFTNTATLTGQNSSIFGTQISQATSNMLKFQIARKKAIQTVADSIKALKELGYKEDNCKMVQIA